ncbi:MAG: GNAT family N-acetyltransferase [Acidimicrobiaceae bacterium]|nr:GNAT family N-acetyltransferase [Acidimicrobiaceae bacterium]
MNIAEESIQRLDEHAQVSIAFLVEKILVTSLMEGGLRGMGLTEETVGRPWLKDYDAADGEGPTRWPKRFDVSHWGLIAAHDGDRRVGGAVIAFDTPGVHMLGERDDLAVLWDLRIQPEHRAAGIGTLLFHAVEGWARNRGCRLLKVETQNINLPACYFYRRMGCSLVSIDCLAYPDLPDEAQLIWAKQL